MAVTILKQLHWYGVCLLHGVLASCPCNIHYLSIAVVLQLSKFISSNASYCI